jgi:hypothetical protein
MNIDMDKVPSTVVEAVQMFIDALDKNELATIKDANEESVYSLHRNFGFCRCIKEEWSMELKDTPLARSFKSIGITHPDDMTPIILMSAYRRLKNSPIKLKEQVDVFQSYWMKKIGKKMP